MRIEVRGHAVEVSPALLVHTQRRFLTALARWDRVPLVRVRLVDDNGTKGGVDKRCRAEVTIPRGRTVIIDERHVHLYTAIDVAADRMQRAVAREIGRRRAKRVEAAEWRAAEKTGLGRSFARAS